MGKFRTWFENLSAKGIVRGGQALGREGRVISGKGKRSVNDGPFAEAKEAIGGYLLLTADSLEEATAVAKGMPGLDYGTWVEVRPIATECPLTARLRGDGLRAGGGLDLRITLSAVKKSRRKSSTIKGPARGGRAPFSLRGGQDAGDLDPFSSAWNTSQWPRKWCRKMPPPGSCGLRAISRSMSSGASQSGIKGEGGSI